MMNAPNGEFSKYERFVKIHTCLPKTKVQICIVCFFQVRLKGRFWYIAWRGGACCVYLSGCKTPARKCCIPFLHPVLQELQLKDLLLEQVGWFSLLSFKNDVFLPGLDISWPLSVLVRTIWQAKAQLQLLKQESDASEKRCPSSESHWIDKKETCF